MGKAEISLGRTWWVTGCGEKFRAGCGKTRLTKQTPGKTIKMRLKVHLLKLALIQDTCKYILGKQHLIVHIIISNAQ